MAGPGDQEPRPEIHREYKHSITELQGLLNRNLIPAEMVDEVTSTIRDGTYEMTHNSGRLSQGTVEKLDNLLRRVKDPK